ncbi:hypothetical protein A1O3_09299 [Capronia epimyces CBS 606.96]|uniref:Transcription factor domain-containing protein n=1 Tax=Capronia epimyces CBS 606.96 TaxID=1182542 RepID=W9XD45_9EURO|nr:uncharacterized protein A1O3_09299 [Capronia epimyces CBS 606.96]EXJ78138.1 hypothetical protein A1O3_09299 [Capronia epimyces CBS 606.96]
MSYMLPAHDNDEDNEEDDDEDEREEGDEEDEEETIDSESPDLWVLDDGMFGGLLSKCFQTPGEGIAFAYYFKYLSGLIPAYDGIQNPYRKLSTVALEYPVLLNTIISLATEYMHWHGHIPAELALTRHDRALASIREALNVSFTGTASSAPVVPGNDRLTYKQATLAAVLLQITRVIFSGGNEVDMHLKCALYILQELDYIHRPTTSFIARLLMQRFAIVDVVTSILRRRRPHLPPTSWIFKPQETLDSTEPSFREMTGCPQPIFGYLARACNLAVDVAEDVNNMEVLEQAFRLERDLHAYALAQDATPTTVEGKRGSGSTADASLTTLNECYRWCVHLLIQRRVYLEPTFSRRVQQTARTLFRLMASIPVGSGPDSSLPLLLNLVAREAVREEDRAWVRERNQQMEGVYPDSTRDGFIAMCEKMWRRVDECMEVGGVMLKRTEEALELLEQEAALFMF